MLEQDGTRLPSDRRYAARERSLVDGVEVDAALVARLREMLGRSRYSAFLKTTLSSPAP